MKALAVSRNEQCFQWRVGYLRMMEKVIKASAASRHGRALRRIVVQLIRFWRASASVYCSGESTSKAIMKAAKKLARVQSQGLQCLAASRKPRYQNAVR